MDDSMTAGELRRRYGPGGSAPDSDLTASQLRARHNIHNNSFKNDGNGMSPTVIVALIVLIVAAVGAMMKFSS
ncbi:hypothetical protein Pmar_PMAR021877 [Perkinsus marinus ATCC 50983]|uniref:Uncharacterized protein n=1 Tax=Perkinsus marinus (strain ATCC 50983 / TXsc) TaxID=423536 RepID=C5LTJ3_PERM5|nr:hypothetical protein Pmar_PMAR005698 [Perkinsus marinus ATCC 50983]XP_002767226.1 hypothetical protein Pmar_PMAR021877 [Perkinsus marinus ATCC 50983]EEQ97602.1 hypothetical protein Pmar_PMAR005698 [Perkinsus marinus ATCC 50983]EEQ99943.1 hypothetical protein Pmar_PMAR021877 [Perkinsus marinus ATCC 50983]|eukprot:XP_002764885.1 hypothetical protein Pmar_PMAR005698 [Perkinsus marinus ATCC 50983]